LNLKDAVDGNKGRSDLGSAVQWVANQGVEAEVHERRATSAYAISWSATLMKTSLGWGVWPGG